MAKKGEKKSTEAKEVVAVEALPVQQAKENTSIEAFISQGIQNNVPVETMERLLAMRRELKAEHAREAFIAAMATFQAECPVIVKDTIVKDKYGKERYRYAALDSIVTQVKTALGRNGLSYTIDIRNGDNVITAVCKITHILGHSEVSSFDAPIDKDSYMSAPQRFGAASTFAKRYAFQNALGILTGDQDTDTADMPGGAPHTEDTAPNKHPIPDANNPVFANDKKALSAAKTLEELGAAWSKLNGPAKIALGAYKDELKAIITSETGEKVID